MICNTFGSITTPFPIILIGLEYNTPEGIKCSLKVSSFTITVYSDGRSLYNGYKFVEMIGDYEARLSAAQIRK